MYVEIFYCMKEDGHFKRLSALIGSDVDTDKLAQNGFIHYVFGKDIAREVDVITGKEEDFGTDEEESSSIQEFFGEDCYVLFVPMSDRELRGNGIYDASFLVGINLDEYDKIKDIREFVRIGVPFAGEMPIIEGMPVPVYYDYMPINYCPHYVVDAVRKALELPDEAVSRQS